MSSIVFSAIQTGYRQLREKGCWSLTLHTQEIDINTAMELSGFTGDLVKVLISDDNIKELAKESVEALPIDDSSKYTPSQKLRFAIEDYADRKGEEDPKQFYKDYMQKLIDHVNKL